MTHRLLPSVRRPPRPWGFRGDLVYELTEREELPCQRLGRREVISRRAMSRWWSSPSPTSIPRS